MPNNGTTYTHSEEKPTYKKDMHMFFLSIWNCFIKSRPETTLNAKRILRRINIQRFI